MFPLNSAAAAQPPLASGWLRTKGRDSTSVVASLKLQQMKAWNLWWVVLAKAPPPGPPFFLRCYGDDAATQLKARGRGARAPRARST